MWASGIFGIAGVVVGAFLGNILAVRSQRKQWLMDNRRAEYRELLSTVYRNSMKMGVLVSAPRAKPGLTVDEQSEYDELNREAVQVIDDRLFIAREIARSNIRKEWVEAEYALRKHGQVGDFSMGVHEILKKIRASVEKIID